MLLGYLDGNCQTDSTENRYFYYDSVTICTNIKNIQNVAARIQLYQKQIEMLKQLYRDNPDDTHLYATIEELQKNLRREKWKKRGGVLLGVLSGYIGGRVHEKLLK